MVISWKDRRMIWKDRRTFRRDEMAMGKTMDIGKDRREYRANNPFSCKHCYDDE